MKRWILHCEVRNMGFNSLISSTAYTLVIVLLIQLKIIDTPVLFTNG
ncbi:hypothetical protein NIES806_43440 [Dolichospermum compactum NIES-806]|uniref:Uncharacterized protein n=1 Tax=Dolichospermum compactum NIES-806 TaxID=1973481 RepID=A0A1Z4V959_9CYAN|nr:hypothetical protein NIES806_43440 [Dolichospermum compactum NIES-806]